MKKLDNHPLFFSRSFSKEDDEVNNFFLAIAEGMSIGLCDVGHGTPIVPVENCRDLIATSAGLIAVAVKRKELSSGHFAMPDACRDEISMAYGLRKPILLFCEEGVDVDGFAKHFCTRQTFSRENLFHRDTLRDTVRSLMEMQSKCSNDFIIEAEANRADAFSERTKLLVDLKRSPNGWFWHLISKKKIIFNQQMERPLIDGAWASNAIQVPGDADKIDFSIRYIRGNKKFKMLPTIRSHSALLVDCATSISPTPGNGDWIEYEAHSASRYLNPIVSEDLASESMPVLVGGARFTCIEGLVPVQPTEQLEIEIRFENGYPIGLEDPVLVAGPCSNTVDHVDEKELSRIIIDEREVIGGELRIRIRINKPKEHFVYGVAWNPPSRVDFSEK
jgi:hypothetical protein